ncbi:MAG: DNA polymerase III subunit beta [Chitinophagales bacterium]
MKFIVSTSNLLKQVQLVSGVISANTVLPILENFLFKIEPNKLTVFATDLETSMSSTLEIQSEKEGLIAVPAKILLETLKTLPEQPLTFSYDEKSYAIEITSENGRYKLAGENGEDFPKIPEAENVSDIHMPASVLNNAISKTLFAVSNDDLRPAMTGVLVQLDEDGITFVATDAHKLVRYRRLDTKSDESGSFIVPRKALNLLKNALPNNEDAVVDVSYNNSNGFFSFENIKLICRLIDAKFPDYNAVIPTNNESLLTIGRKELQDSLKRIVIFSNKTTNQVMMRIAGSDLQVSAQDLDFSNEANERLTCNFKGEDMEIGFNAKFLAEMLGILESDEINLELGGPTRAGILLPAEKDDNEELMMLVMPVMLNS